jgi:hypothetical protein
MDGIDAALDAALRPVADGLAALVFFTVPLGAAELPLVVLWLVAGAVFFTLRFRFINLRGFPHAIALLMGRYDVRGGAGQVSHFQALATAVSGTVGIGNIGGVAVAVSTGGPGAAFWLLVAGFLGISACSTPARTRTAAPPAAPCTTCAAVSQRRAGRASAASSAASTRWESWWAASASATCSSPTRPSRSSST